MGDSKVTDSPFDSLLQRKVDQRVTTVRFDQPFREQGAQWRHYVPIDLALR